MLKYCDGIKYAQIHVGDQSQNTLASIEKSLSTSGEDDV
jgi:hypothetical protein